MSALVRHFPPAVDEVCSQVRASSHVAIRGSGSLSHVLPAPGTEAHSLVVSSGITRIDPGEMVIECLAGTPVADVQAALAEVGQRVNFPDAGTVGGVLASSRNSVHRLGRGAVRDSVLRMDVVDPNAVAYRCGGNTVKNVSGFDLCRLHVGAFGTLGVIVSVLLRTFPLPRSSRWMTTSHDVGSQLITKQWGATCVLSNGSTAFTHFEGHPRDLDVLQERWSMTQVSGPPTLGAYRWSTDPAAMAAYLSETVFGEIGVGIVHEFVARPPRVVDSVTRMLNQRVRDQFDPRRVLNRHIDVLEIPR